MANITSTGAASSSTAPSSPDQRGEIDVPVPTLPEEVPSLEGRVHRRSMAYVFAQQRKWEYLKGVLEGERELEREEFSHILFFIAKNGQRECCELLIRKSQTQGFTLESKDFINAFKGAAWQRHYEVITFLLEVVIRLDLDVGEICTEALIDAAGENHHDNVKLLALWSYSYDEAKKLAERKKRSEVCDILDYYSPPLGVAEMELAKEKVRIMLEELQLPYATIHPIILNSKDYIRREATTRQFGELIQEEMMKMLSEKFRTGSKTATTCPGGL